MNSSLKNYKSVILSTFFLPWSTKLDILIHLLFFRSIERPGAVYNTYFGLIITQNSSEDVEYSHLDDFDDLIVFFLKPWLLLYVKEQCEHFAEHLILFSMGGKYTGYRKYGIELH